MKYHFYKKVRLYPTSDQKVFFGKNFGFSRFVWNWCVQKFRENYESNKDKPKEERVKMPSGFDLSKMFIEKGIKEELIWIDECDSRVRLTTIDFFSKSLQRFFSNPKKFGSPNFKKKTDRGSYTTIPSAITVKDWKIKLPKIGWVDFRSSVNYIPNGKHKRATISFDGLHYYVSVLVEQDIEDLEPTDKTVGLDLGIKTTITTSGNETFNFKLKHRDYRRIKQSQRYLSRTKKDSKRRIKAKKRLKKRFNKLTSRKRDFIQQTTTKLVRENDIISVEDLNVSGMMKNHHLARKIAENNFYELRQCLSYKCEWYGRRLVVVDRWYPSSQLCSHCGGQVKEMKDLGRRTFKCPCCGLELDRDLNAAINIRTVGDTETGLNYRADARGGLNKRKTKPHQVVESRGSSEPRTKICLASCEVKRINPKQIDWKI